MKTNILCKMKSSLCDNVHSLVEFFIINVISYFIIRLFEILFLLVADGNSTHKGINLNLFIEFSFISLIIGCLCSCCALKWEYGVRRSLRIQHINEVKRQMEKETVQIIIQPQ